MSIKEAIGLLVYNELGCDQHDDCEDCPYHGADGESCWKERYKAAEIVKEWFDSLPEGHLLNITLEDLL